MKSNNTFGVHFVLRTSRIGDDNKFPVYSRIVVIGNFILDRVRDLFLFSCYTGLSYIDLMELRPDEILTGIDKIKWIKTTRAKTDTPVNVPLLKPAQLLLEKFSGEESAKRNTVFPYVTNARHTFATTVTFINGVPIETIGKMLGHTKISATMQYAKVTQTKIGMDLGAVLAISHLGAAFYERHKI